MPWSSGFIRKVVSWVLELFKRFSVYLLVVTFFLRSFFVFSV